MELFGRASGIELKECFNNGNVNTNFSGAGGVAGVFEGYNVNSVENCENRGEIVSTVTLATGEKEILSNIGGIVGLGICAKQILGCINYGNVTATGSNVGGISGGVGDTNITLCINRGEIAGFATVGGITGFGAAKKETSKSTIENCKNEKNIKKTDEKNLGQAKLYVYNKSSKVSSIMLIDLGGHAIGGIAGATYHYDFINCSNFGDVTSLGISGGIVGSTFSSPLVNKSTKLNGCENHGNIKGNTWVRWY